MSEPAPQTISPIEPPEALDVDLVTQLLSAMVAIAHEPARFTDAELDLAFTSWNELLTAAPVLHRRRAEFFAFHQALLIERDYRDEKAQAAA